MKTQRNATCYVFLMIVVGWSVLISSPQATHAQWTTNGNNINNTNSGNVGVGTTTPGEKLEVVGTVKATGGLTITGAPPEPAYQNGLYLGMSGTTAIIDAVNHNVDFRDLVTSSKTFRVNTWNGGALVPGLFQNSAGSVGVGTTTPIAKFHVLGGNVFHQYSTAAGSEHGFYTAMQNNHVTSNLYYDGQWRMMSTGKGALIGTAPASNSAFSVYADNTSRTTSSVASVANLFNITMDGRVGIGSLTPPAPLFVTGDEPSNDYATLRLKPSVTHGGIVIDSANNSTQTHLRFYKTGVPKWQIRVPFQEAEDLRIFSWGTNTDVFTLKPNGNIGVGTITPAYKFDVQGGQINSAGGLCIAGDCKTSWSQLGSSQWTTSSSNIYFNTGSVGIGISAPIYSLDVNGGVNGFRAKAATASANDAIATFENAGGIQVIVRGNGNVGIGTVTPGTGLRLDVSGNGRFTGDLIVEGNIAAKYQDVAEWVPASHMLPPGTVVSLDPDKTNHVEASATAYDTRVAGVVSEQPGIALGERGENKILVATTGRVLIKADTSNGPIGVGDLLVTSDVEGVAMKSEPVKVGNRLMHMPGTLIGKALEPLKQGSGKILVLLSLQ